MNSARVGLQRSFVVTQARVVVDEVGAPETMGVLNFLQKPRRKTNGYHKSEKIVLIYR